MNRDYLRLLILLAAALIMGLLIGQIFFCLFIATAGYLIWYLRKSIELLEWVKKRDDNAPELPGVYEEICREVDRLQTRHKKRKKKLSNYLQQFHQATTALPDATVVLDADHRIQWSNKAAAEFLNVHWPQDQRQRLTNLVRSPELIRYMSEYKTHSQNSVEIKSPLDAGITLSVRIVPYGKNQRLFVARDVTRLQKLVELRKDFVANVSHELRTPITVLRGYLETMLQNKSQVPEHWQNSLGVMHDQSVRMEDVIKDLLMISRLEEDRAITNPETVIVPEMIGKIHKEASALSGDKKHLFEISADPKLWIRGSSAEIYSAFSNLVFNAVRYTPENGLIKIHWYKDDQGAHLEIRDNGIGIPPQHISRLTERFYRVEQSRSRDNGGSGLGLSIVKHVLTRHKATLHIESELEKGSLFRCDFPASIIVREMTPAKPAENASK